MKKVHGCTQLADKTLGVIGLGRIGWEVAKRAQAFQMKVIAYDPFLSAERAKELNVERAERVEDLLPKADYITVHTPKTDGADHRREAARPAQDRACG